jgi:hypothetical protein
LDRRQNGLDPTPGDSRPLGRTHLKGHSETLAHAAFALLRVEDLHPQRLNQVLAKIAAREPDLRLAA